MLHELKILEQYADEVYYGLKTFEIRYADRGFNVGDTIHFTVYEGGGYVEHPLNYKFYEITYILSDDFGGLQEGFCALGIKPYNPNPEEKIVDYSRPWILKDWTYPTYPTFNPPYEITCETDSNLTVDYNKLYGISNSGKDKG